MTEMTETSGNLPQATVPLGTEGVDKSDLLIPKVMLMQGLSEAVGQGKAKLGEGFNSVTEEAYPLPIEIIPISTFKNWQIFEFDEGENKHLYKETVPYTPENCNWEWEEGALKRQQVILYYVMLASELKEGPHAFPAQVSFKSTSRNAGQRLSTHLAKGAMFKLNAWSHAYQLGSDLKTKEGGGSRKSYHIWTIGGRREATTQEQSAAFEWYNILKKGDHSDHKPNVETDSDEIPF